MAASPYFCPLTSKYWDRYFDFMQMRAELGSGERAWNEVAHMRQRKTRRAADFIELVQFPWTKDDFTL